MAMISSSDFKYFIQDISKIYIGANYTYEEILKHDDVPFKLKMAVNGIFLNDVCGEYSIAGHLTQIKKNEISYLALHQLKIKIKVTFIDRNENSRKHSMDLLNDYCSLDEFMTKYQEKIVSGECFAEEVCIKKLHLSAFSL